MSSEAELLELVVLWALALGIVAALVLIAAVVMLDHRAENPGEDQEESEQGFE